jgi:hypothetical protein
VSNVNASGSGNGAGSSSDAPAAAAVEHGRQPIETLTAVGALEWTCKPVLTATQVRMKVLKTVTRPCLFCGHEYSGGPAHIRNHIDIELKPRNIMACTPTAEWKERFLAVRTEFRRRAAVEKAKSASIAARQAGRTAGLAAASDTASTASTSASAPPSNALFASSRITSEMVQKQWARVLVKKALPLDLFDDPEFRTAVALTAKAGSLNLLPGGVLQLCRRKKLTTKVLPELDKELDTTIRTKMAGIIEHTGVTLMSDGWTNVQNRPILNVIASCPLGSYFIEALDTSGETKDAEFIADFMKGHIIRFGPEKVVALCMDGACKSSFPLIEEDFSQVQAQRQPRHHGPASSAVHSLILPPPPHRSAASSAPRIRSTTS